MITFQQTKGLCLYMEEAQIQKSFGFLCWRKLMLSRLAAVDHIQLIVLLVTFAAERYFLETLIYHFRITD